MEESVSMTLPNFRAQRANIPFPPGHVLIMSISSGVALYTAATPELAIMSAPTLHLQQPVMGCEHTAISRPEIHANNKSVLCG